jgi:hypothetical protein
MGGPDFHAMFVCHKMGDQSSSVYPHLPHVNNTNKGFGVGVGEAFAFGCHHENLKKYH